MVSRCVVVVLSLGLLSHAVNADDSIIAGEDGLSLKEAVTSFNRIATANPIGAMQPPLTEDEVVAAIRLWDREHRKVDDKTVDIFQKIAKTKRIPKGASIGFMTLCSNCGGYDVTGWWVDIEVTTGKNKGYRFRIRDRKISSRPARHRAFDEDVFVPNVQP